MLLLEHTVVAQVLLAAAARERLHELLLGAAANGQRVSSECWEFWDPALSPLLPFICHRADLKADFALAAFPLALVQADHEGLVALLPVQRHGLVALAEDLNLILLHVGDNLRNDGNERNIQITKQHVYYSVGEICKVTAMKNDETMENYINK